MKNQESELSVLIRARYPLIYLVSWEEDRAQAMLKRLAQASGKNYFSWTSTRGLCGADGAVNAEMTDPRAILDFIEKQEDRALYVLMDFHAFLQDAKVIRRLRDLLPALTSSYKTVLILSPQLTIPVELEKDVTVLDYDLPGPEELNALFDQLGQASSGGARFQMAITPEQKDRVIQAAQGLTLTEAANAFARAAVSEATSTVGDFLNVILLETKQVIRKSRLLEYFESQEEFAQVGGLDGVKDWARKRGRAFSEKAKAFGLPDPKGVLMLGVQGCGKSLSCKALSSLWRLPLLRLDMGAVFGGFVGQSEENMRRAIKTAEAVAPCILWLDEIEKGLSGTQSSNASDAGTTARVFSTFLTWLQEKSKPVFVAATANNIQMLPPELLRKGRFDEIFFIDLPTPQERRDILSIHIKRKKRDPAQFPLDALVDMTSGYSGAEIEQAVVSALFDAFNLGRDLQPSDIEAAIRQSVPLSTTMREEIDALRQWAATRARPATTGG